MDTENDDVKVGYKHPPKDKQFKKGEVRNRTKKRKPKDDQSFRVLIDRMFERPVTVSGLGRLTMREAIAKQLVIMVANRSQAAAKLLIRLNKRQPNDNERPKVIFRVVPDPK